ncbi:MAG TPA: glycoside hydrolase family 43 protein [Bacteroidota bacterium]|nr:glycoside hydrolase family 43 protein [Bacteroidota bacterium]
MKKIEARKGWIKFRCWGDVLAILFFLCCARVPVSGQTKGEFTNPILAGFNPDPSVCRVGDDFYLVNSTFSYFPGISVSHSRDLVHWKLIGYVLDRPEQFNLDKQGVSRGIFAPAIRYHDGNFYVTCTLVDIGGNFVATAKNPAGPWSKPAWLPQVNGIDPSLFFDDDGKSYLVYNSIPPENKSLYPGHRTLRIREFNPDSLTVSDEERILVNGGTDISKKPVWIEGPHILKKDGFYYLIAAEGGTAEQHSEVVFKSAHVFGPYVPYNYNPILTQRDLDQKRMNPITCTGHADFVEGRPGEWWAVFLGCRPYPPGEENYYNTGRETFLAPVRWRDGWPVINPDYKEVQYYYPDPLPTSIDSGSVPMSGNFHTRDKFDSPALNLNWVFLRTPHTKWYDLQTKKGFLSMELRPETCEGNMNPSFLGHRQQHLQGSVSTSMIFAPQGENEKAGLLVFQNERHFYFVCKSMTGGHPAIELYKSLDTEAPGDSMELVCSQGLPEARWESEVLLKIDAKENFYAFSYAFDPGMWLTLKDSLDAKYLSTKVAGGFVGCMYALYATSQGRDSGNWAHFDWFDYAGNDRVYK